jgi:hypothetical protein
MIRQFNNQRGLWCAVHEASNDRRGIRNAEERLAFTEGRKAAPCAAHQERGASAGGIGSAATFLTAQLSKSG